ncbi:MAG: SurA N-terminal domain-containing protein [Candidatus Gottesmanbacteria bacterium]
MTTKTKKTKAAIKVHKTPIVLPQEMPSFNTISPSPSCYSRCGMSKTGYIAIILGVIILGLLAVNKGLIIAAVVNNKPIFRWTMNKALVSKYGMQTLENMITEQLIGNEAKRLGIAVTQQEIDTQQQEILKNFGGNVTLEEVLKFQGMTKTDFDQQIRLQMLLTKLIGKDVTITDEEITKYTTDNPSTLVATDSDGMKKEARETILMQKVGEQLQPWFTSLKEKAKIYRFIK